MSTELTQALKDAATSLETISRLAGKMAYLGDDGEKIPTYMEHHDQVRGYAASRATCAREALAVHEALAAVPVEPVGWLPTAENVNALPAPIREYVHGLEALCDPSGIVRDNTIKADLVRELSASNRSLRDKLDTPGNRHPQARYSGYVGEPLDANYTDDEAAAWHEGRKAAHPAPQPTAQAAQAQAVPAGFSLRRQEDGRIVVKAPIGWCIVANTGQASGIDSMILWSLADAMLAASAAQKEPT